MNSQTQVETELIDEETTHAWNKAEEVILKMFRHMDIDPNDALNILIHTTVHIALMDGTIEKETLLAGVSETFDHALEQLIAESEVH